MKYELLVYWLAFKWMFRINLGNKVKYKNKTYTVVNGVISGRWTIVRGESRLYVPRKECRLVLTPKNIYRSFQSGKRFYRGYWLDIWKREGAKGRIVL